MKCAVAIIVLCLISGCATRWHLNGATQAQFDRDDYYCSLLSTSANSGGGAYYAGYGAGAGNGNIAAAGGAVAALEMANSGMAHDHCMRSKGYIKMR